MAQVFRLLALRYMFYRGGYVRKCGHPENRKKACATAAALAVAVLECGVDSARLITFLQRLALVVQLLTLTDGDA